MTNPRILMINNHIHFGGGGDAAFRHERQIYEEIGYEVYTFSMADKLPASMDSNDRISLISENKKIQKFNKYLWGRSISRDLRNMVREINPHLVHIHLVSDYPVSIYSAVDGYPVIHTLHGPNLFCATSWGCIKNTSESCDMGVGLKCLSNKCVSLRTFPLQYELAKRAEYWCKKNVLAYLCPSKQIQKSAELLGYGPAIYLPLGIDRLFEHVIPENQNNKPVILYVGALVEQKGLYYLIEAFEKIVKELPDVVLKIAGKGNMEDQLKHMVKSKDIQNSVDFLGFQDRKEILELYKKSTVLAVPSIWSEQFGLVGPEALACGLPVVASNIGGIPEWLIDNKCGYLVKPRDSMELADKLLEIIKDKELRKLMSVNGREYVLREFSSKKYKENILNVVHKYMKPV